MKYARILGCVICQHLSNKTTRTTDDAIAIPGGLSFLAYGDFNAEVQGLNDFPANDVPPVAVVHVAFQIWSGLAH